MTVFSFDRCSFRVRKDAFSVISWLLASELGKGFTESFGFKKSELANTDSFPLIMRMRYLLKELMIIVVAMVQH